MVSATATECMTNAAVLAPMDAEGRATLLRFLSEGKAESGSVLLGEGALNDQITFLTEGHVVLTRSYPGHEDETIATLNAPTLFGETSFFRRTPSLVTIRAKSPVHYLVLGRDAYESFRQASPEAAEQFALASVRLLAERFDLLDRRVSDFLREQSNGHARSNEWAAFRARLFEESGL